MNIEHCRSSFMGSRKHGRPETQRPCARLRDADRDISQISVRRSCHGLYVSDGVHPFDSTGILPVTPSCRIAAGRLVLSTIFSENRYPLFRIMPLRMTSPENRKSGSSEDHAKTRARCARELYSTTNVVLFEQRLVTRLVLPLDVIEQRTARRRPASKGRGANGCPSRGILKCPVRLLMRSDRIAT